ncbi:MAG: hypothetical protein WKF35_03750 [Ferruginibacter sp.]
MKKTVILLTFCFLYTVAFSQSKMQKDSLMKVMALEACDEVKKKDFSNLKKEDLEMELGLAVVPIFSNHADDIKNIFDFDISESDEMRKFGQELGIKLAVVCPEFIKLFANNKSLLESKVEVKSSETISSVTLLKVMPGEFTYFLIKDKSGKTEKIWWMNYFEGSEILADVKNINKTFKIKYQEMEVYNSGIKDYIKIKVASGLEK